MKKNWKAFLFLFLLYLYHGSTCVEAQQFSNLQSEVKLDPQKDTFFTALLEAYRKDNAIPGAIIGLKKVGETPWIKANGWSDIKHQRPFTDTTLFRCGSITKLFTAIIALQLVDEDKLHLSDTITAFLPYLKSEIENSHLITIKQLLNHSSGLGHPTEDNWKYRLRIAFQPTHFYHLSYQERLKKFIYKKPLKHFPGESQYYSNAGYWILSELLEKIEGKKIDQLFNERIIIPLALKHTYLSKREDHLVSRGYSLIGQKYIDVTKWDRADCDGDPAAGLISTAYDLLVFGEALFSCKLISEVALKEMLKINELPICTPKCEYGLGIEKWNTTKFNGYGKNGSSVGVDANILCFPDQQKILVIFSNFGKGSNKNMIDNFISH